MTFDYLLDKIADAEMSDVPFAHVEIADFLTDEHFQAITHERQIALDSVATTEDLLDTLEASGYQIIPFPGCALSKSQYLKWFNGDSRKSLHPATEGFGMVCRLTRYDSPIVKELDEFFRSDRLRALLVEKFGIEADIQVDAGIQKYLHGYEISPHPDTRRKALTWMLNLNPSDGSEHLDFHTHYMRLKDEWRFIGEFWRYNPDVDRCWLPWDWCTTVKQQARNNTIVFFSPTDDSIHAVKASYDHLRTQRTQAYGNLWYQPADLKIVDSGAFRLKESLDWRVALKGALYNSVQHGRLRKVLNGAVMKYHGLRNVRNVN